MAYRMNNDFFDEFAVLFTPKESIVDGRHNPLGYYASQMLDMDGSILRELKQAIALLREELTVYLCARSVSGAAVAQEKINAAWVLLGKLPVYSILQEKDKSHTALLRYMREHPDEVEDMITAGTDRNRMMTAWLDKLETFPDTLSKFRRDTLRMLEHYFEELPDRSVESYARAYGNYRYTIRETIRQQEFEESPDDISEMLNLQFSFPAQISYRTMRDPDSERYFLAEGMSFEYLSSFLYVDFYRGMTAGNLPRRCRNCNRFFLAIGGYDTVYCNNIAPGETKRTCRKVGAHKAEKLKTQNSFALKEYDRVYNRLKQRRRRGTISDAQWNALVGWAQELKDKHLRGEVTNAELVSEYQKM